MEKTGEAGEIILVESPESMGRKDVELEEKGVELKLTLLLPLDSRVVMEVLDSSGN